MSAIEKPDLLQRNRDRAKRYRRENPEAARLTVRNATLRKKYGIVVADYDRMLAAQGGVCKICLTSEWVETTGRAFHVDHCHQTGRIRGLLCQACNTSLGKFKDSPALLRAAAAYLEAGR